jgi:hypothetical protein
VADWLTTKTMVSAIQIPHSTRHARMNPSHSSGCLLHPPL